MITFSRGLNDDIALRIDGCHDIESNHTSTLDEVKLSMRSYQWEAINEKLSMRSYQWEAINEKLSMRSYQWEAINEQLSMRSYQWEAIN